MAGHITCSVCSFLPQLYTYCYHNCTNVSSEMVSMVMVAITTVLNYNKYIYSETDFPDCVVIIRGSVDRSYIG